MRERRELTTGWTPFSTPIQLTVTGLADGQMGIAKYRYWSWSRNLQAQFESFR